MPPIPDSYRLKTEIFVRLQFAGFHRWPNAPAPVGFLANKHRHNFHVEMRFMVGHLDRDVEFILVKHGVLDWIKDTFDICDTENWSCEHWANHLITTQWIVFPDLRVSAACTDEVLPEVVEDARIISAHWVRVSEDDENGAIVSR